MPPVTYDRTDPHGCEVVTHIAQKLAEAGKDSSKALAAFHYMRKSDRGIIVFDSNLKKWRGCDHVVA
jgi:hypothetical protein